MKMATVHIQRCEQDSGTDEAGKSQLLTSRLYFDLEINGLRYPGLSVHLNQPRDSNAPVEVASPIGYNGPFDQEAFNTGVAHYYRRLMRDRFLTRSSTSGHRPIPRIFDNLTATFSFAVDERCDNHRRKALH